MQAISNKPYVPLNAYDVEKFPSFVLSSLLDECRVRHAEVFDFLSLAGISIGKYSNELSRYGSRCSCVSALSEKPWLHVEEHCVAVGIISAIFADEMVRSGKYESELRLRAEQNGLLHDALKRLEIIFNSSSSSCGDKNCPFLDFQFEEFVTDVIKEKDLQELLSKSFTCRDWGADEYLLKTVRIENRERITFTLPDIEPLILLATDAMVATINDEKQGWLTYIVSPDLRITMSRLKLRYPGFPSGYYVNEHGAVTPITPNQRDQYDPKSVLSSEVFLSLLADEATRQLGTEIGYNGHDATSMWWGKVLRTLTIKGALKYGSC